MEACLMVLGMIGGDTLFSLERKVGVMAVG
jgi:hypothetical protein